MGPDIFVKTSPEIAAQRALGRDAGAVGGVEATRKLNADRYHAAFELYEILCAPGELADAVFDNHNPARSLSRHDPARRKTVLVLRLDVELFERRLDRRLGVCGLNLAQVDRLLRDTADCQTAVALVSRFEPPRH